MSEGRKPIILVLEINQGVVFDIAEVFFNRRERFELRSIVISLCMPAARAVLLPTRISICLALVIAVYSTLRFKAVLSVSCTGIITTGNSDPCARCTEVA